MSPTAQKWDPKVSYILKQKTVVGGLTNKNYSFNPGVGSINIYTTGTMDLNQYDTTSDKRFGNVGNIELSTQTFDLEESIAFTGVLDNVINSQNLNIMKPGAILAQQLKERIIPYIDTYTFQVMETALEAASQSSIVTPGATTKDTAYGTALALRGYSINNEGPQTGYRFVTTSDYYNDLKQSGFVTESDLGQKMKSSGFLGNVDGTPITVAPTNRLPSAVDIMCTHPIATTFATQLKQFDTINKAVGYSGPVLQGVETFDAFVDANKVQTLTSHKTE